MEQLIRDAWLCEGCSVEHREGTVDISDFHLSLNWKVGQYCQIFPKRLPDKVRGRSCRNRWPTSQTGYQRRSPDFPWERHRTPRHASSPPPHPVLLTAASFLPKPTHTCHGDHLHFVKVTEGKTISVNLKSNMKSRCELVRDWWHHCQTGKTFKRTSYTVARSLCGILRVDSFPPVRGVLSTHHDTCTLVCLSLPEGVRVKIISVISIIALIFSVETGIRVCAHTCAHACA